MSTTDELRRMLDERGVEYVPNMFGITWGYYSDAHTAAESMDGTLIVTGLTPEQAVAATLGVGTCTNFSDAPEEEFLCSRCGLSLSLVHKGDEPPMVFFDGRKMVHVLESPVYCPFCGRKVEG